MSRPTVSKSRAEKGKPPTAQTPVVTHEIVPGKFNDYDWNIMQEKDGAEEFIMEILDEIVGTTMDTIFNGYIAKQLVPYTVSQAKDAILQIIDWQFLTRDSGETKPESDATWLGDEEPDPAVTDCWAQGSVPRTYLPPPTPVIQEEEEEHMVEEEEQKQTSIEVEEMPEEEPELPDHVSEPEDNHEDEKTETTEPSTQTQEVAQKKVKRKTKFKPHRGPLKSAGVSRMTESLEDTEMKLFMQEIAGSLPSEDRTSGMLNMPASCQSILRSNTDVLSQVQAGRPPGHKDVIYDEMGNVVAVVRLDPEKLPSHRVRVKYQVVDPAIEAAQARLEAMRHGKSSGGGAQVPTIRRIQPKKGHSETASISKSVKSSSKTSQQPSIAPLPPPLIEAMDVAPGVTVKEGGRVKKGPNRYVRKTDMLDEHQNSLRPVGSKIPTQALDVSDLLDRTTPILRPIGESPPLPPILPHPPSYSRIST